MSNYDTDTDTAVVLRAVKGSLDDVTMQTPLARIVTAGQARRRRRRIARAGAAGTAVALTALGLAVPVLTQGPSSPESAALGTGTGAVHIRTVAFSVDSRADGSVQVTWDKARYFEDRAGLQAALREAGFPVLIKEGVFCRGPQDDGALDPSGVGPGVRAVMRGTPQDDGRVTFVFTPSAVPAGQQLFIGYLSAAQLATTHGSPGSVERLVPAEGPLTCTTQAPPANPRH